MAQDINTLTEVTKLNEELKSLKNQNAMLKNEKQQLLQ